MTDPHSTLEVVREDEEHAVVVRVLGELDMATTPLLAQRLYEAESTVVPPTPVVLDLGRVRFIGSTGLALLIEHHRRCAELGIELRLVADHNAVLKPLHLTSLDTIFTVVPTMRQALDIEG
ncbi:anti-sigma factor antagonist [Kutzneria viridogrisea]|uniref:Anti-sigma factor antagonist n=1 Tax=Kutzneria viridogrisea TaxID=47990 RepID=A0ABR6BB44_9PSEU|nr:anti-anti-sigma factor [Kutzneria viridogrisea]